ncbi:hypothetical protein LCGC14_3166310, partial [marine sediment metagenome]
RRKESIIYTINKHKPDVLINVAALKHIDICEKNPYESVQTNILGNQNIIESIEESHHRIKGLIFTSTDKACKPINVYGMCKSISEKIYQNYAENVHANDIKVAIVRYGNVLESTGSVIPFFKNILGASLPDSVRPTDYKLPVTHEEMTRFFLTLDEAVNLLIDWAYHNPYSHGSIAIPKTKSMKIKDLAELLISVYDPEVNKKGLTNEEHRELIASKIEIVGIRPGEKLHEELISEEESLRTIEHDDYYLITNKIINNDPWTYSSKDDLIDTFEDGKEFLDIDLTYWDARFFTYERGIDGLKWGAYETNQSKDKIESQLWAQEINFKAAKKMST